MISANNRPMLFLSFFFLLIINSYCFASLPQDLLNKKLTAAVEIRDKKHIKALLDKGAEVEFSHIKSAIYGESDSDVLALLLGFLKTPYTPKEFHKHLRFYADDKSAEQLDSVFTLLLKQEPSIALQDDLLLLAANKGSLKIFESLQKRGAKLTALKQDKTNGCLLNNAINGNNPKLINLFLAAGFKPTGVCDDSLTIAINKNKLDLVKQLLAEGALVDGALGDDAIDRDSSPLAWAVNNGNIDIVRLLLKNKASLYKKAKGNDYLFILAVTEGHLKVFNELLLYNKSNHVLDYKKLFMVAAKNGRLNMLKYFQNKKGVNIKAMVMRPELLANVQDKEFILSAITATTTALHYAAEFGHLDLVNYLLEQGLDVNAKEHNDDPLTSPDITALMNAVENGHYELVLALLKQGAKVDLQDENGFTALYKASFFDHNKIVELLVNYKASYAFSNNLEQPIHIAARHNNIALIEYFNSVKWSESKPQTANKDKRIFSIDAKDADGKTALMLASINGHVTLATKLIELGASVNVSDLSGRTALHFASINVDNQIVKLLLKNGARADSADFNGKTSLHVSKYSHDIFRALIKKQYQINATTLSGVTALAQVIAESDGFYAAELLKKGANIHLRNNKQQTLLHQLAIFGDYNQANFKVDYKKIFIDKKSRKEQLALVASNNFAYRIEWLIQQGIDINAVDSDGNTALHYLHQKEASSKFNKAMIARLLEAKANVNIINIFSETPLYLAAKDFEWDAMKVLLAAGANPNIVNHEGKTALFLAVKNDKKEMVELLLSKGADINLKDDNGRNPLFSLVDSGAPIEIFELLIKAGIDLKAKDSQGRNIIQALAQSKNKHQNLSNLDKILKHGLDVNSINDKLETALHQAVLSHAPKAIKLLLKNNISIDAQDRDGATALHYAVRGNSYQQVKLLLAHKAKLNIPNYFGKTPLHIAVEQDAVAMVEILLEAGANIHSQDKDLRTPLITAVDNESTELVSLLIAKGAHVNVKSKGGWQALHFAVSKANEGLANMLLEKGADPMAVIWRGDSVMTLIENNKESNTQALLTLVKKYIQQKKTLASYLTPLHQAVEIQNITKIKELLNAKADDINKADDFDRSVLEKAIISSYINPELARQSLELLLDAGADINRLNRHKESLLLLSVRENINSKIVNYLLSKGAKPELADYLSNTPLLEASLQAKTELVRGLLKVGADINQENYAHQTALLQSLSGSVEKTARRLLSRNENWLELSKEARELKQLKAHQQHSDLALLLVKSMTKIKRKTIGDLLEKAMSGKYNKLAQYLVNKHTLDQSEVSKWLLYSIKNKNLVMTELFFEKQDNKSVGIDEGWPLLRSTVRNGDEFIPFLERLLKNGAGGSLAQKDRTAQLMALVVSNDSVDTAKVIFDFAKNNSFTLAIYDPQKSSLLLQVAELGKVSLIQFLLDNNFNIEMRTRSSETPLYLASKYGQSEAVKLLLEKGADPDSGDEYGNTPLDMINRSSGRNSSGLIIARLLLEKGASFDLAKAALQRAIEISDFELAEFFIKEFKIDINQTFYKDASFVLYEALKRLVSISKYAEIEQQQALDFLTFVLSQGADVNKIHSIEKRYPLDLIFSRPNIVKFLLENGANAKAIDPEGRGHIQKLMSVSGESSDLTESLMLLLAAKAPMDSQDKRGNTALHILLNSFVYSKKEEQKTLAFLQILLDQKQKKKGWNLSILNYQNQTPFDNALRQVNNRYKQEAILKVISHLNQFANKPDGLGHNAPLLQACRNLIILKGLLDQGADVNSVNDNGESCLHKLFESTENEQELAIIELLIERGININHQSATGETALFKLAQSKSHFSKWQDYKNKLYVDKTDILLKQKPDFALARKKEGTAPLHIVSNKNLLKKFIAQGIDLNVKNAAGNSLLHLTKESEIAQQLLEHSANSDSKNNNGESPLFYAVRDANKSLINILIKHKAKLDIINNNGDGLLHLSNDLALVKTLIKNGVKAAQANKQGVTPLHQISNEKIGKLLLANGADINARDQAGQTILHYAVKRELPIISWLITQGVNIHYRDKYGETAVFKTAYTNNKKMMMLLLNNGSDPGTFKNKIGDNSLHIALANQSWQVADVLLGVLSENIAQEVNWENKTALSFAFDHGHYGFAKLLEFQGVTQPAWSDEIRLQQGNPFWLQRALQQDLPHVAMSLLTPAKDVSEDEISRRVVLREFGTNRTNLQMAAKLGETRLFETLIRYGNALDAVNSQSKTALMIAIENNRIDAMQALLDLGANPLVRDLEKNTILHMAVKSGNPEFLALILEKKIEALDINAVNSSGQTALQLAAESSDLALATLLLKNKASPNIVDKQSMSALLFAAKKIDEDILKLLIAHKADVNVRDKEGRTPLLLMLFQYVNHNGKKVELSKNKEIVRMMEYLLDHGANIEEVGKDKRTALLLAIQVNDIASVLLKRGANIHAVGFEGNTALLQSVRSSYTKQNSIASTRLLLKMGADTEHYNQWKESALHIAIRASNFPAISLLIDSGAKIDVLNKGGYSPLHNIVQKTGLSPTQKIQLVKQLIAQKVDLNKRNPIDNTALNIALFYENNDVAKLLIEAGIDVNLVNHSGNAAIHFLAKYADISSDINSLEQQAYKRLFLLLKQKGADLKLSNASGNTPLQQAITSRNDFLVELLLKEQSVINSINQLNFSGFSALHMAVRKNNKESVRQLIQATVKINLKDNAGNTALHLAVLNKSLEIIKLLRVAGAKADIKNFNRKTAMDWADNSGDKEIIGLLGDDN